MIIIFRIQIIIFIILIIISNLSSQSLYSNNCFLKTLLTIIIMIIVIIIFLFFLSAGSADPAVWVFKPKGYEHRPRRLSLHPSRGSAGQALGGLYTLGSRGCRPTHPRAAAKSAGLPLAPKAGQTMLGVYFLGPWPSAEAGPNALAWQL